MADGAARAIKEGARAVVVLAGVGHVAGGRGVPQRIERRLPGETVLTIVPLSVDSDDVDDTLRRAIRDGDADILVVPRFEQEIAL
jgi:uncharacterized iron-regulated protein